MCQTLMIYQTLDLVIMCHMGLLEFPKTISWHHCRQYNYTMSGNVFSSNWIWYQCAQDIVNEIKGFLTEVINKLHFALNIWMKFERNKTMDQNKFLARGIKLYIWVNINIEKVLSTTWKLNIKFTQNLINASNE